MEEEEARSANPPITEWVLGCLIILIGWFFFWNKLGHHKIVQHYSVLVNIIGIVVLWYSLWGFVGYYIEKFAKLFGKTPRYGYLIVFVFVFTLLLLEKGNIGFLSAVGISV